MPLGGSDTYECASQPSDPPKDEDRMIRPIRSEISNGDRLARARSAKARRRSEVEEQARHPATSEIDYTAADLQFLRAVDEFKRRTGKQFPTLKELLAVVRSLGYSQIRCLDDETLETVIEGKSYRCIPKDELGPSGGSGEHRIAL